MLTANLRLLPLLLQRFEIADVMMLRPHIRVVRDADGESNWTPFIDTIARTMKPGADNQVSFSEIRIQDGVLSYQDAANHVSETLDDIDLSLAWPSISRSFAATGQFDWRGERVDGCDQRQRLRRRTVGRPLRPEGAARQRAAEAGVRRHRRQPHQHDDGRHADHRQPVLAQRPALDRPARRPAPAVSAASR